MEIKTKILEFAHNLDFPEAILCREINSIQMAPLPKDKINSCYSFLVDYGTASSNLGYNILFDIINRRDKRFQMERSYYPEPKLLRRMKKHGIPLFSKESFTPLKDFDIILLSGFFHAQVFNIINTLDHAGIPRRSQDRINKDYPLIVIGGVITSNPEPFADFVDIVHLGEGEEAILKYHEIFQDIMMSQDNRRLNKDLRQKYLLRCAKEVKGAYVPEFYKFEYNDGYGVKNYTTFSDVPQRPVKAIVDISKIPPVTEILIPTIPGCELGLSSYEISRGCSNFCSFCEASFRTAPYRERRLEMILKDDKHSYKHLINSTGSKSCTLYSFNLSDHSGLNTAIKTILDNDEVQIGMSSQRLDLFNEDFAKMAKMTGHNTLTVAIEHGSETMRKAINKNLTDKQILDAFEIIFRLGFHSVKVYNISSLPFENEFHVQEEMALMEKIQEIRNRYSSKSKITWSYTGFQAKSQTPMQWAGWELNTLEGSRDPQHENFMKKPKNKTPVFDWIRKHRYWKGRVGTAPEISTIAQVISMADRRMGKVIEAAIDNEIIQYSGNMSVGKGILSGFNDLVNTLIGNNHNLPLYVEEKPIDIIFPWDHFNYGVTKEYLKWRWSRVKDFKPVPKCFEACSGCGACTDKEHWNKAKKIPEMVAARKEDISGVSNIIQHRFKIPQLKWRLKIHIDEENRFIDASKIKTILRRAFWKSNFKIKTDIELLTDTVKYHNWTYGIDYAQGTFLTKEYIGRENEILNILKNECKPWGVEVIELKIYHRDLKSTTESFDLVLYEIPVDLSAEEIERGLNKLLSQIECPICNGTGKKWENVNSVMKGDFNYSIADIKEAKATLKQTGYPKISNQHNISLASGKNVIFKLNNCEICSGTGKGLIVPLKEKTMGVNSWKTVWVNVRECIETIWHVTMDNKIIIRMLLRGNINPYQIMPLIFSLSKREVLKYPVKRILYLKKNKSHDNDLFAGKCCSCNKPIEYDVFDEQISNMYCAKHLLFNGIFKTKKIS